MSIAELKRRKKISRVVGLDLSTNSIAFSVFDDGRLVRYGEIRTVGSNVFEKLGMAQKALSSIPHLLVAEKIIFEGAIYVQNKKTVILLAYTYGAIISALARSGVEIVEVTPLSWGKRIGNNGLTKEQKAEIVEENPNRTKSWYSEQYRRGRKNITKGWVAATFPHLPVEKFTDNLTDAIAIGWAGSSGGL